MLEYTEKSSHIWARLQTALNSLFPPPVRTSTEWAAAKKKAPKKAAKRSSSAPPNQNSWLEQGVVSHGFE